MKERVEDQYYYPCRKHPSSSPVGICAYCLKDRLMKLVCSDCGEQRLSSCSCSDVSSYRNSVDVGSVGRISFLIENDELFSQSKDDAFVLKRSNSCVVEVKKKKSNRFWRIGKLFRKKERNIDGLGFDESWGAMDVSRCRSVCSFRGDHDMAYNSSAKISDFNESEPRKSGFRMDLEIAKETSDDSGFIDLKLDESKTPQHFVFKNPSSSSSCRITVNERGIKKGSKGHGKVWKWIFKQHSAGKKDLHHIFESSSQIDR